MAIKQYTPVPILVDLPDLSHGASTVKLRARRKNISLTDDPARPCVLLVELLPFQLEADGSYGPELTLTNSIYTRKQCRPLAVDNNRLLDSVTGRLLATRYNADYSLRPESDWQADIARLAADDSVQAMYQADWFCQLMAEGMPEPIDAFIVQYIQLAYATGDLV